MFIKRLHPLKMDKLILSFVNQFKDLQNTFELLDHVRELRE